MIDVPKQIAYWSNGAEEDWEVAQQLVEGRKFRHGLFFAHLALEKILKAHVTKTTADIPPRIHDLARLGEIARLPLSGEQFDFLGKFNAYQLEGRYPDAVEVPVDAITSREKMSAAKEVLKWLKARL